MEVKLPQPRVQVRSWISDPQGVRFPPTKKWRCELVGPTGVVRPVSGWLEEDSERQIAKLATEWANTTGWVTLWVETQEVVTKTLHVIKRN
jgi:hypothetical protein